MPSSCHANERPCLWQPPLAVSALRWPIHAKICCNWGFLLPPRFSFRDFFLFLNKYFKRFLQIYFLASAVITATFLHEQREFFAGDLKKPAGESFLEREAISSSKFKQDTAIRVFVE